jgi:hypothetical protein
VAIIKEPTGDDWRPHEGAAAMELPLDAMYHHLESGFLLADGMDIHGNAILRITQAGKEAAEAAGEVF